MSLSPFFSRFPATFVAIQTRMPVVMEQMIVALCFLASVVQMLLIVISFPSGTFLII